MPNKVEIIPAKISSCKVDDSLIEGYLAFAYPGKFVGFGITMEEALLMAKMHYRNAKKRFLEKETETSWLDFATDRQSKMDAVHEKWGIREKSTWNEDSIEKKVE